MKKALLTLMLLMIASGILSGAFAVSVDDDPLNSVNSAELTLTARAQTLTFSPAANGEYDVCFLPLSGDAAVSAKLLQDGKLLAQGEGMLCSMTVRLTAGETYTLSVSGQGAVLAEIARSALSRSVDKPLELADGDGYSKLIARSGDVHWYAVTASRGGAALISCRPENAGLHLQAQLFDSSGRPAAQGETLSSGSCVISAEFTAGQRYLLRVSAQDGGTGKYMLENRRSSIAAEPEYVRLSESGLTIDGRGRELIRAQTGPSGASPLVFFDSSDPAVAVVLADGTVESRSPGSTVITAYGFGGARAQCGVTVKHVPVEGVEFGEAAIEMTVGDELRLNVTLVPQNASVSNVTFVTEDAEVVTVSARGLLTAVGEGVAQVAVVTEDGGLTDVVRVTVRPAGRRYRALLIGEQNYASTVEEIRPGSTNSVESIAKLLKTASFEGEGFQVSTLIDAPRDTVVARIRETFADAAENDVALVYITCHGYYRAGMSFFLMVDGSVLSAAELEQELRAIPGQVLLLADCCGSGGLLANAGTADRFLDGVTGVFQGTVGTASVRGSRVKVLASALLDQDSYRISFSGNVEEGMATVFARALCDAAGWSIDRDARSAMNADVNYDGAITLDELASYMARRVNWYLDLAGSYIQTVNVYPEGDALVVMSREN